MSKITDISNSFEIPVENNIYVVITGMSHAPMYKITEEEADSQGECSIYQLCEGYEYDYEFIEKRGEEELSATSFSFVEHEMITPARPYRGKIKTGIYVGSLELQTNKGQSIWFEVRSLKSEYRTDYRRMMNDITEKYAELVMMQGSPVTQKFEVDFYNESMDTLYQKFAFVQSVAGSAEFEIAIQKIITNPVRKWIESTEEKRIENVRKTGRSQIRQITSRNDRTRLCNKSAINYLPKTLTSLPRKITIKSKTDTIDTPENQFVKHILTYFYMFCNAFEDYSESSKRLKSEARNVCNRLQSFANNSFFNHIGTASHINLNSPVLQRKEGYREILQAWLMFDLAAKLSWEGGDNVYKAGSRNVAALYEYWLFFQLMDVVEKMFYIPSSDKKSLVNISQNGINLGLKQGKQIMVSGECTKWSRNLKVALYYNRTFKHTESHDSAGTWTAPMRPDYTLSVWPGDVGIEEDAEKKDMVVHIHFDAKYKVQNFITNNDQITTIDDDNRISNEMDIEKEEQERGTYKRVDLLKMHAYKDAIRRTGGAYILYPGTEGRKEMRGFHEIIPGLGAFCMRPGRINEDKYNLISFITQVTDHFLDRISQRERIAAYTHRVYSDHKQDNNMVCEPMPEYSDYDTANIPAETLVAIGYVKDDNHLEWINHNKVYNFRTGSDIGSLPLKVISAKYLLLHNKGKSIKLYKIDESGPLVYDSENMMNKYKNTSKTNYQPSQKMYIVFKLEEAEYIYNNYNWNINDIWNKIGIKKPGNQLAVPAAITLADLMLCRSR